MKLKKEILIYVLNLFKWLIFTFVAIYGAQRVAQFMYDPYGELGSYSSGMGVDVLITMSAQTVAYVIIFGMIKSLYKLLFKKDYTWQTLTTFGITLSLTLAFILIDTMV